MTPAASRDAAWWRRAVVYQVYLRSFADADGDGTGDIAGIRSRLPYLRDLGVDALWVNPWYPSPMIDGGYDVADYRAIDPRFGTLDDARGLVEDAHALGLRLLADIVPNHTSWAHPWFREALASPPGSRARGRYVFRDGRGPGSELPPNNWMSVFGGRAWTREPAPTGGAPAQWYLHLFDPSQPDLNWDDPEVADEFLSILRFWFDLGIDGFRIDVAHALAKDPLLPDVPEGVAPLEEGMSHPYFGQEATHDVYRRWRQVADSYPGGRVFIGEIQPTETDRHARLARYLRSDELHQAFNFDFLRAAWDAGELRAAIGDHLGPHAEVGAPVTWVLSNHDVTRHVTRYGRASSGLRVWGPWVERQPSDVELGRRRARAAALLILGLPGSAYLYQGEELGLDNVDDLPDELLEDPTFARTGGEFRGRDGCRVPLPWSGDAPPFGFGPPGTRPWLPQPAAWADLSVEAETGDASSMLELYRTALQLRHEQPGLAGEGFRWLPAPDGVLAFERDAGLVVAVNLGTAPLPLPAARTTLLRSDPGDADALPPDAAIWYLPG